MLKLNQYSQQDCQPSFWHLPQTVTVHKEIRTKIKKLHQIDHQEIPKMAKEGI